MNKCSTPRLSILTLSLALTGMPLFAAETPRNFSAFAEAADPGTGLGLVQALRSSALVDRSRTSSVEPRLGVPTFLWAAPQPMASSAKATAADLTPAGIEAAARRHLGRYAPLYRMSAQAALGNARLREVHNTGAGGVIARFDQEVDGIEVLDRRMSLLMDRTSLQLRAIAGYFAPHSGRAASSVQSPFRIGMPQAIAAAFADLHHEELPAGRLQLQARVQAQPSPGAYQWYELDGGTSTAHTLDGPVRIKRVYYPLVDALEPAFYLELNTEGANHAQAHFAYVISAADGRLLARTDLSHTAATPFSYRVWADARGPRLPMDSHYGNGLSPVPATPLSRPATPVTRNLITLGCASLNVCDPWLPPTASRTHGNNVSAYADISKPNGYNSDGDLYAELTGPATFDYPYDPALPTNRRHPDQLKASIVQAFYTTNLMHDWLYDHGFNEQAGNAQDHNYSRGGEEGDRMLVEVADFSGRNNANMYTPRDGASPVMQMYLWDHPGRDRFVVTDGDGQPHRYTVVHADFGPKAYDIPATPIVPVNDGVAPRSDGCSVPFVNADRVEGAIALIDRGDCLFMEKALNAQSGGAIGVVIANNRKGEMSLGGSGDPAQDRQIRIPVVGILQSEGEAIRQIVADAGAAGRDASVTMTIESLPPYDAALDNTIVVHEWAHMLSERLTTLGNNQGWSLGEGWSDLLALLAMVRPGDRNLPGNDQFQGAYAVGFSVMPKQPRDYPWGIRRYPYSTDMDKNPLTFRHISDNEALPRSVPAAPGTDRSGSWNSEVHNAGEVWSVMLWDAFIGLVNDGRGLTFAQARDRMLSYLVASLKMTPADPTYLEARDALLAVAEARDPEDLAIFWRAFARRGAGVGAVAPPRDSWDHAGVVESYETP